MAWSDILGATLGALTLVASIACGDDSGPSDDPCMCQAGGTMLVCGIDGVTYEAICGTQCVPVDIACMRECPCDAGTGSAGTGSAGTGSAGTGSATADGSGSADGSSTAGIDDCDCDLGAYIPACGVDGMTYDATCGTQCVPVDIACMGECPCPQLDCGPRLSCGPRAPVCTEFTGGPAGSEPSYSCDPIPPQCLKADPDCPCVSPGCECTEDPEDYFYVVCAAP